MAKKKQAETHSQRLADAMKSIYTASTPLSSILPVQDRVDVAGTSQAARTKGTRIEKAKGRSKTSQILGGIARGAGWYLGGAIGAILGTVAGGGVGSAVLGTGGAIAGYNVGSKVGDYLYKKGRQLATGKKGEAAKVKFKDFMKKIRK